ncbi:DMT family transporter [Rhizobium sp. CG4]|jgi:drug/metabolite transporter (DMT)-like permease|uniref:DMT family transporter n=1 Tax=Rhizobium sp. CG4 TaxID=2726075 RepID=UPI0020336904|nr:DMT family transporter [Rhizobium sp. CG4]MCM2455103.1 DMT family transporter [Rhizobium sp. CG4]
MAMTENTRGAMFMALAMASFTINDALVKSVTPFMNTGQIMFVRGVMTTILIVALAKYFGALRPIKTLFRPLVLVRTASEISATVLFLTALGQVEFASISSIMQSLPLVVTLGAALFLGEPVGWRRWVAIGIGFAGVLIIIRPGSEGFTTGALLAIASVFVTACRDLVTRRMYADVPSLTISMFTATANTAFGALLIVPMGGWQPMEWSVIGHLAVASILVLSGYQTVIFAMRSGEISFVAPFRYTSLLWALMIGILVFQEKPDIWTLIGAAIVIASGIYTFYRERRRYLMKSAKDS